MAICQENVRMQGIKPADQIRPQFIAFRSMQGNGVAQLQMCPLGDDDASLSSRVSTEAAMAGSSMPRADAQAQP